MLDFYMNDTELMSQNIYTERSVDTVIAGKLYFIYIFDAKCRRF